LKDRDDTARRPLGAVIDTSFEQMFYAFYTLEADDIDVIGNELRDNVVYGLDPHDRSHRLRLAYNTAYGTRRRHGIIISREVDDSWIVGNISFDNNGTGIMIDRDSIGVYLYANTAIRNGQDGITFFESSCGLVASNYIAQNDRAGIKVRNSWDIGIFDNHIARNGQAAIEGYAADLKQDSAHDHRDFSFDPYETVTSISAADNRIEANDVGVRLADVNSAVFGRNHWIDQSPKLFSPEISAMGPALVTAGRQGQDVAIANRCAQARPEFACRFRASGHLTGDGQGILPGLRQVDQCTPPGLLAGAQEAREPDTDDDAEVDRIAAPAVVAQAAAAAPRLLNRRGPARPPVVSMIHVADQTGESAFRIFDPPAEAGAAEGAAPPTPEAPR
ncbi:MAG: right-handed parallel beta-helix repeat-containing protein, partial [Alphaproteobacteria bacterium]